MATTKVDTNLIDGTLSEIAQVVSASTTSVSTNSTNMPADGTTPQNDEGDQILTCSITPTNSSSKLVFFITISNWINSTAAYAKVAALFKDSDASAVWTMADATNDDYAKTATGHWIQTAGSTSSQTYKLRVGSSNGNVIVNNSAAGGLHNTLITIWEVVP